MKILLSSFLLLALSLLSFSQAPQSFSYQAIARDATGIGIANQNIGLRISILQNSVTGTSVYTETHTVSTDANGVLNLAIGTGAVTAGTFSSINWGAGTYFVKIEMDITGGTNYVLMGTSQLLSVPYALYAGNVNLTKGNQPFDLYVSDEGTVLALKKITVEKPYTQTPTVTDVDGNIYGTVKIGTQVWMTENLRTTKYNDATLIPNVTNGTNWLNLTSPAYANYNNTANVDTIQAFGRIYNHYAVVTNKLCPTGWHVPTESEFQTLLTYLGPLGNFRMRANNYWSDGGNEINDTYLSVYPSGERYEDFLTAGSGAFWWGSTISTTLPNTGTVLMIYGNGYGTYLNLRPYNSGYAVRCIKN